jgi:alcohol dehydrogenase (cytochrome c)
MKYRPTLALLAAALACASASGQQAPLVPAEALLKRLAGDWPTYSGDYSGQRYSQLSQVSPGNVAQLTLAWAARMNPTVRVPARTPSPYGPAGDGLITTVGGEGKGDFPASPPSMKGSVLEVDGVLYVTAPDHVWALDARDGRELWHYFWKTRGGTHIANRGAAIWKDSLLFETPDNYLVSLDARTGAEKWHVEIASLEQ